MNSDDLKDDPKDESAPQDATPEKVEVVDDAKVKQAVQMLAQQQKQPQQLSPQEMSKLYVKDVAEFMGDRMLCARCQVPYRVHPIFKLMGEDRTVRPLIPIPPLGILSCGLCGHVEFFAVDVLAAAKQRKHESGNP